MKFFTPDLVLRFGSTDDAVADAAHEEWEKVNQKYLDHLERIRPQLPRAVRSFLRNFCLHDARLLALGVGADQLQLSLFLELDSPRDHGILLTYHLSRRPELIKHPELAELGTPIEWLYDEFDLARRATLPATTHFILFTGGRELRLAFRALRVLVFEKVLAPAVQGQEADLDSLLAG
jgi:hypothetical protein